MKETLQWLGSGPSILENSLRDMRCALFPPDPAPDLSAPEVAALRRGGFELAPVNPNALARTAADAVLCKTSLTEREVAQRLGVDPNRVRQLLVARKLYGLQIPGGWKIPVFQLEGNRLMPGLEDVLSSLPEDQHPVGVYQWFMTPNPDLVPGEMGQELSPREWLFSGYSPRAVAELATDLDNL